MKKRETHRWIEPRKDNNGNLLCLIPICNNLREGRRNYCKSHTYQDMWEYTSWPAIRKKALERDNFTCVKCGDNRKEILIKGHESKGDSSWVDKILELKHPNKTVNNLIGDHIKPIALGGEEFDLKNVQTLCLKCNKEKTSKDIKKIATRRRVEKILNTNKQIT